MNNTETVTLHGGPWHGQCIEPMQEMGSEDNLDMIIVDKANMRTGSAIYERKGENAFWLENHWYE